MPSCNRNQPAGKPAAYSHVMLKCLSFSSGRGSAWLEHLVRDQGVGGSNPLAPIFRFKKMARAKARAFLWVDDFVGDGCFQSGDADVLHRGIRRGQGPHPPSRCIAGCAPPEARDPLALR